MKRQKALRLLTTRSSDRRNPLDAHQSAGLHPATFCLTSQDGTVDGALEGLGLDGATLAGNTSQLAPPTPYMTSWQQPVREGTWRPQPTGTWRSSEAVAC